MVAIIVARSVRLLRSADPLDGVNQPDTFTTLPSRTRQHEADVRSELVAVLIVVIDATDIAAHAKTDAWA
jgi:hypothetical protein